MHIHVYIKNIDVCTTFILLSHLNSKIGTVPYNCFITLFPV